MVPLLSVHHRMQEFGQLDILVSNAAVNPTAGPLVDTPAGEQSAAMLLPAYTLFPEARVHQKHDTAACCMHSMHSDTQCMMFGTNMIGLCWPRAVALQ